ncbi:phosphopantetheine-binding protein [Xanthomonas hydrangeae]|uniref:Phosphopantetheine-binding protein n=1 Tax=Xanthomonas hydrangeae TaxID=2775159 RepID=A0AAU0B4B7_9XANT|nr:phosphopantetheine-binding protein [Xanthomonas hydrangeae]WOB47924.1 phosphopantetheine-binding protein [Xanthomonas hydrangeae]
MSEDIGTIINSFIANYAGVPAESLADPDVRLDSLNIDSLGVVELLFDIEEKYAVHIDDPLQLKDLTLQELHAMVAELIERKAAEIPPAETIASAVSAGTAPAQV